MSLSADPKTQQFCDTFRDWMGRPGWSLKEAARIIAGVFVSVDGHTFRFHAKPSWRTIPPGELGVELEHYTSFLRKRWKSAGLDLSPQPPEIWISRARAIEEPMIWLKQAVDHQRLRSAVYLFRDSLESLHSPQDSKHTAPVSGRKKKAAAKLGGVSDFISKQRREGLLAVGGPKAIVKQYEHCTGNKVSESTVARALRALVDKPIK